MKEKGKENKETIIFLHGVVGNQSAFKREFDLLSKNYHVVSYDYIGYGEEDAGEDNPKTIEELSDQLLEIYKEAGVEKAHLCALSYGSLVASHFAGKYPEKVASLTFSGGYYVWEGTKLEEILKSLLDSEKSGAEWVWEYVEKYNPYTDELPKEDSDFGRSICYEFGLKLHENVIKNTINNQLGANPKELMAGIQCPVRWIMGAADHLFKEPVQNLKILLPQAEYEEIEGAGHVVHLEKSDVFMEKFEEFLMRNNYANEQEVFLKKAM